MTTPTDIPIPDETTLRRAGDGELTRIAGLPDGSPAAAMTTFNRLLDVDSASQRRRLLETIAKRSAMTDLGAVTDALSRRRRPLEDVTDLLDVDGVGPKRFLATVRALADADLDEANLDIRVADTRAALADAVPEGRAVDRLLRLVLAGQEEAVFSDDTPGLDLVRKVVADPESVAQGTGDPDEVGRAFALLSRFTGADDVLALARFDGEVDFDPPVTTTDDDDDGGAGEDDPFPKAPASPWVDGFLAGEKLKESADCPQVSIAPPLAIPGSITLGDIENTQQVIGALARLERALGFLYLTVEALVVDTLVPDAMPLVPDSVPKALESLLRMGVFGPIRDRLPARFLPKGVILPEDKKLAVAAAVEEFEKIERELTTIRLFPRPSATRIPRLVRPTIEISGPPGTFIILNGFSRMLSTYSFGQEEGTYSTGGRSDRPWFALIAKPAVDGPERDFPASTLQLGELGAETDVETEPLVIPDSGKLSLRVKINGNYGQLRLVVDPPGTPICPRAVADLFMVSGPYEQDARDREQQVRFDANATKIKGLRDMVKTFETVVDFVQSVASAFPGLGGAIGALADAVEKAGSVAANDLIDRYEEANKAQRTLNMTVIESLPEKTPPGSPEAA